MEKDEEPKAGCSRGQERETNTLQEVLAHPENKNAEALVVPLEWCPHLEQIGKIGDATSPPSLQDPCLECSNVGENWVCLVCHEVHCSRYVNEHMLLHGVEKQHLMSVSLADLSVWCYGCESYVDNEILRPIKNELHKQKFGVEMPGKKDMEIQITEN